MDDLGACFLRSVSIVGHNNRGCYYNLEYDPESGRVISATTVLKGAVLGALYGTPRYIWEVNHSEYIFVDEDLIVDVSHEVPRQILSLMRDDNQSDQPSNCEVRVEHLEDIMHFSVVATRNICPGDELVYAVQSL